MYAIFSGSIYESIYIFLLSLFYFHALVCSITHASVQLSYMYKMRECEQIGIYNSVNLIYNAIITGFIYVDRKFVILLKDI